jgi:hypothetical protein
MSKSSVNKNKLNSIVSVLDFGAVGNGVADDTAAFPEITLVNSTGNIRTKTGANLTRTGLGSNRLIGFVRARDGNYYQL